MALNNLGLGFVFTAKDLATRKVKDLERSFDKLEGSAQVAAKRTAGAFKQIAVGLGLMAAGVKGLKILGSTVETSIKFGKAIAEVSTLVDEATFSTAAMKKLTTELAATFGIDALEQAPALYQAISAGATTVAEATQIMTASNKLAIGGVTDLTTSVDVLTTAVNVFGAQGLTAADATDVLIVTMKQGKTTVGELGSSIGRVLPTAKQLGISFEEVGAALAATTKNGLDTRRSVTGMTAALANVIKPSKDAKDEAKRLGVEFNSGALRAKGFSKFLDDITTSSKFNKTSIEKLFGSMEGLNFIASLTSESSKEFRINLDKMADKTGAADDAVEKMNGTLDRQIKRYQALKTNVKIAIGEALEPVVVLMVKAATVLLRAFDALPKPIQKLIAVTLALVAAMTTLLGIFLAVRGAAILLGPAFRTAMLALGPMLIPLLKFALIAGVVIAAIFLLKKAFDENIGGFGDSMREIFNELKPAFIELKNAFVEVFKALFSAIKPLIPVIKFLAKILIKQLVFALKVFAFVLKIVAKIIVFFVKVLTVMFKALAAVIRFFVDLVKGAFNAVVDAGRPVVSFIIDFFRPAWEGLGALVTAIADGMKAAWRGVKSVIQPIIEFLTDIVEALADALDSVIDAAKAVGRAGKFIGGGIKDIFVDTPEQLAAFKTQQKRTAEGGGLFGSIADLTKRFLPTGIAGEQAERVGGVAAAPAAAGGVTSFLATLNITTELDGEVIARKVAKVASEGEARR